MSASGETQSDYFWMEDIQKMDAKVRELESSRPESVEAFFEERRSYVELVLNVSIDISSPTGALCYFSRQSALDLEKRVSLVTHGSRWARYEAYVVIG